jgi:hypothetical protein
MNIEKSTIHATYSYLVKKEEEIPFDLERLFNFLIHLIKCGIIRKERMKYKDVRYEVSWFVKRIITVDCDGELRTLCCNDDELRKVYIAILPEIRKRLKDEKHNRKQNQQ